MHGSFAEKTPLRMTNQVELPCGKSHVNPCDYNHIILMTVGLFTTGGVAESPMGQSTQLFAAA